MAVDEHLDERGRELLAHRPGLIHGAVGRGHVQLDVRESIAARSEEHTSELQSQSNLVCRLLLEKKKTYEFCRSGTMSADFRIRAVDTLAAESGCAVHWPRDRCSSR